MSAWDFRSRAATLRRRAAVLVAAGLLGLAAGVAYVAIAPPPLTSTALVLLPTPALAESSNSDVATQVQIALSADILQRAGDAVDPKLSAREVETKVNVSGATDQLIRVDATSASATEAQALAQAVADNYVNYVVNTAREVTSTVLADLANRRNELQSQINQLQAEIAATAKRQRAVKWNSPEGRAEARLLTSLRTQQADLALQLDKVKDKIAAGTPVASSANGTTVVQRATVAQGPSILIRLLTWPLLGALAATLLAVAIVLAAARRDPRIRSRDEIADAIGSPVLASLRSRPQRSAAGWSALLESYQATPTESWALRQVLRGLVPVKKQFRLAGRLDHPESLTVVSLSGDEQGLALGPQLAGFTSSLGILTRLVPSVGQDVAPTLWASATEQMAPHRTNLFVGSMPPDTRPDLTIFLVVAERTATHLRDTPASAATLLSVAAGAATEQELARLAVAVDDAGRRIDGIVVADPDQTDRTSGRHTSAERSRWPALPTRLTGIASSAGTSDPQRSRP